MAQPNGMDGYPESARGNVFRVSPATPNAAGVAIPNANFLASQPFLGLRLRKNSKFRISLRDLFIRQTAVVANPLHVALVIDTADRFIEQPGTALNPFRMNQDETAGVVDPGVTEACQKPIVSANQDPARGSIKCGDGSQLVDTETFVLDDGTNPALTFEFDSGGGITGDVAVAFTAGDSADTIRDAIIAAVNGAAPLNITAFDDGPGLVGLVNVAGGTPGNVPITDTVVADAFVFTGMSGGRNTTPAVIISDTIPALGAWESKSWDLKEAPIAGAGPDGSGSVLLYVWDSAGLATPAITYGLSYAVRGRPSA